MSCLNCFYFKDLLSIYFVLQYLSYNLTNKIILLKSIENVKMFIPILTDGDSTLVSAKVIQGFNLVILTLNSKLSFVNC